MGVTGLAFALYVSELVHQEARSGNPEAAERRHEVLQGLPSLALTPAVRDLGSRLLREGVVPASSEADAVHIAVAAVHGIDYLMTWNLRHIANAQIKWRIERTCVAAGLHRAGRVHAGAAHGGALMTTDQIVDEVRAVRAALLQAAGGTLDGLLDLLTREEAVAGRTAVVLTPKRPDDHEVPRIGQPSS